MIQELLLEIQSDLKEIKRRLGIPDGQTLRTDKPDVPAYTPLVKKHLDRLTKREKILLSLFEKSFNSPVSCDALADAADIMDRNTLWAEISRLRRTLKRIEPELRLIALRGHGYGLIKK